MIKTKGSLRLVIFIALFTFLIISTYYLMGKPSQQPIQIGWGLLYNILILGAIHKRIYSIKVIDTSKNWKNKKMYEHFNIWTKLIFIILALYSSYLFLLAKENIRSILFSSIWLELLIISFQSIPFLMLSYQLNENTSEKVMARTFFASYIFLSMIFGWTSAQIADKILLLPAQQDLFIAVYGLLLMPFIFILYFDKVYDYLPVY